MSNREVKKISFAASVIIHGVVLGLFLLINLSFDYTPVEYVELSFGISGEFGSSGATGKQIETIEDLAVKEEKDESKETNAEVKEVELPIARQTEDENIVQPAETEKEKSSENKTLTETDKEDQVTTTGQGNKADGEGSFGFDIEWGGSGTRKIYSYILPDYPEGVRKEADIRLRFTILPDGTVGTIIPVTKADTRLENAAIQSLRQWRFEALNPSQKQAEQVAVIVFPYRLQ